MVTTWIEETLYNDSNQDRVAQVTDKQISEIEKRT